MCKVLVISVLILALGAASHAAVQTWTVAQAQYHPSETLSFSFDGTYLLANMLQLPDEVPGWDFYDVYALLFKGRWAALGTYSADGTLTPDPYASFVTVCNGYGYVVWSSNTPIGYQAPLVVGRPGSYSSDYLALYHLDHLAGSTTVQITHTFYATVPEPAGVLALGMGLMGLVAVRRRRVP